MAVFALDASVNLAEQLIESFGVHARTALAFRPNE